MTQPIPLSRFERVVVFTGAGMSAESGVPTYRGQGGIWKQYNYQEYACQRAFDRDPEKVLDFHEVRRGKVLECQPHEGHAHLAKLQEQHPNLSIVTQNIDGMHQRAGSTVAAELHGSAWRVRCETHGVSEDLDAGPYRSRKCPDCGAWLRPDITWFEDMVDMDVFGRAQQLIDACDLFVSIGTSAIVMPAAAMIPFQRVPRPKLVEINPEETEASGWFDLSLREPASKLARLLA